MKRTSIISILLFVTVIVVACSDDDDVFVAQPKAPMSKDDVLVNLEACYNQRNLADVAELLDDDFVFFFSEADYSQGDIPVSWERPDEMVATTNLFNPNYPGPYRATNIDLKLTYTEDDWDEVPQGDDPSWYSVDVEYDISVMVVAGIDYIGTRLKAQIVIREVIPEGESEKVWRIVEWRDLGDGSRTSSTPASNLIAETTWGGIKALYQE